MPSPVSAPDLLHFILGAIIMVAGVVVPLGVMFSRNKKAAGELLVHSRSRRTANLGFAMRDTPSGRSQDSLHARQGVRDKFHAAFN
mmetsp:Transcript_9252/g.15890  ORF Transcript_9252/g.15890 Transcript_9252/m.15890 type:complete len:86 (+) Transcript_9252:55-312(+)